jgi:hypothetical protein
MRAINFLMKIDASTFINLALIPQLLTANHERVWVAWKSMPLVENKQEICTGP